jgi:hypothetical protein
MTETSPQIDEKITHYHLPPHDVFKIILTKGAIVPCLYSDTIELIRCHMEAKNMAKSKSVFYDKIWNFKNKFKMVDYRQHIFVEAFLEYADDARKTEPEAFLQFGILLDGIMQKQYNPIIAYMDFIVKTVGDPRGWVARITHHVHWLESKPNEARMQYAKIYQHLLDIYFTKWKKELDKRS